MLSTLAAAPAASALAADAITGPVVVKDGDYLIVGEVHVRLYGIDAFERAQVCGDPPWPCGETARDRLVALVADHDVACEPRSHDRWDRVVAICRVGTVDLGAVLVREGLAVEFQRWSYDYVDEEKAARAERVGVWAGPFTFPWDFRREAF
ncbi:MAG: thermonuclease family protein [Alphaproteobacteria bacterium]